MINRIFWRIKRKAVTLVATGILLACGGALSSDLSGHLIQAFLPADAQRLVKGAADALAGTEKTRPSSGKSHAQETSPGHSGAYCNQHFLVGARPTLAGAIATRATLLCFEDFAVLHSGVTKTPLYAAEHLTRENIKRGKESTRSDNFHPESLIQGQFRAELNDYKNSGLDRGHMAADKNAPWSLHLDSLANMVPQAPALNRGEWAELEKDVRRLAMLRGEVYVLTGPAFEGKEVFIGRGVRVPSHVWKIVKDPKRGDVQAFVARNSNDAKVEVSSVAAISKLSGLRFD